MDALVTIGVDAAFFVLFALAIRSYLRVRTALSRDLALLFASVAVVLAVGLVRQLLPQGTISAGALEIISLGATVFLLAQPFLIIRVLSDVRPSLQRLERAALLLFLVASVAFVGASVMSGTIGDGQPSRLPLALTLALVTYFVGLDILAAILFIAEARQRKGAAQVRLGVASLATVLFGLAIFVAGAAAAAAASSEASTGEELGGVTRVVFFLAGVGYLMAFYPPAVITHPLQRSIAHDYLRDLVNRPPDEGRDELWVRLAAVARTLAGSRAVVVTSVAPDGSSTIRATDGPWEEGGLVGRPVSVPDLAGSSPSEPRVRTFDADVEPFAAIAPPGGASRVTAVNIGTDTETLGHLLLFTARSPLFVEDDLELLELLVVHTARAIERQDALSEVRELVDRLRAVNADLTQASTAKSDFLAAMSHELRTPLHAVLGFSELLLQPDGTDQTLVREYAGHIHSAGQHLLELINEVLDLARVESGRLDLRYEVFDLSALVNRTGRTMRPLATRKQIELVLPVQDPLEVQADASRVRQIVYNLLSNAIKFTPEGGRVTIELRSFTDQAEEWVELSVTDTGPGISEDQRRLIFEPFMQTASSLHQEGSGLGLALTRQLVELHNGRIEVQGAPGGGTRFAVALPRLLVPAAGGAADREALREDLRTPSPLSAFADTERSTGRPTVLVVEDDPRTAELIATYVQEAGIRPAWAPDGERALAALREHPPDAVILDVLLPGMDGWEVLRQIKADGQLRQIPVLVVSILDGAEGIALGAVDYLMKPVRRDDLRAGLARLGLEPTGNGRGATVLAVDDDVQTLDLYAAALPGHRVLRATDGTTGIRLAREHRPDVILLDLLMADVDGWEVAARLSEDPTTRDIPVLAITSADLSDEEKQRLSRNVRQVLAKGDGASEVIRAWLAATLPASAGRP